MYVDYLNKKKGFGWTVHESTIHKLCINKQNCHCMAFNNRPNCITCIMQSGHEILPLTHDIVINDQY